MNYASWIIGTLVLWVLKVIGTIPLAKLFARWSAPANATPGESESVQAREDDSERATESHPVPDYLQQAHALIDEQRLEQALEECQKAVQLHPQSAEAHNLLGTVLDDLGKPQEAIEAYRQALGIDPDYADAQKNLQEALGEQQSSTRVVPEFSTGHYILADVLVMGIAGLLLGFFTGSYFFGVSWKARNWPGMLVFIGASFVGSLLSS